MAELTVQEGDRAPLALEERVRAEVKEILSRLPALHDPHNLIVRRTQDDAEHYYVALECTIAPDTPVAEAHLISHALERELRSRLEGVVDVFVHLEPLEKA